MLRTWIHRIKPGKEARLRDWFAELSSRSDEVRKSLAAAGVRAEQAFVLSGVTGALLVYVSEADNHAYAEQVYDRSTLAIDADHRRVMEECVADTLTDTAVYDMSV
jgi:hypothetical protein